MKTPAILTVAVFAAILSSGCEQTPEPEKNHVLEDHDRTVDRARQTEQQVLDAAQRQREQIDAQSGEG